MKFSTKSKYDSMQLIFKVTKLLHKYIGLILILFMLWMAISGILMNHPDLISSISVPGWLVPEQYHIKNWNRSSLINLVFSAKDPRVAYLAGKQGIWKSEDGGFSFSPMMNGLPNTDYYRKTKHLLYLKDSDVLLVATFRGLFFCNTK